jgi:hypothetical protein
MIGKEVERGVGDFLALREAPERDRAPDRLAIASVGQELVAVLESTDGRDR